MLSELQDPPKKSLTMQMNPQMFRPQQLQQLTPQQQQLLMQQRQAQQQQLFQQQQFQKYVLIIFNPQNILFLFYFIGQSS